MEKEKIIPVNMGSVAREYAMEAVNAFNEANGNLGTCVWWMVNEIECRDMAMQEQAKKIDYLETLLLKAGAPDDSKPQLDEAKRQVDDLKKLCHQLEDAKDALNQQWDSRLKDCNIGWKKELEKMKAFACAELSKLKGKLELETLVDTMQSSVASLANFKAKRDNLDLRREAARVKTESDLRAHVLVLQDRVRSAQARVNSSAVELQRATNANDKVVRDLKAGHERTNLEFIRSMNETMARFEVECGYQVTDVNKVRISVEAAFKQKAKECSDRTKECEDLRRKMMDMQAVVARGVAAETGIHSALAELGKQRQTIAMLTAELDDRNNAIKTTSAELEDRNGVIKTLYGHMDVVKKEREDTVKTLFAKLTSTAAELRAANEEIGRLYLQCEEREDTVTSLTTSLNALEAKYDVTTNMALMTAQAALTEYCNTQAPAQLGECNDIFKRIAAIKDVPDGRIDKLGEITSIMQQVYGLEDGGALQQFHQEAVKQRSYADAKLLDKKPTDEGDAKQKKGNAKLLDKKPTH